MKTIHNKIKFCLALVVLFFAFSCEEEDDYEPPYNDFSSLTIWTSFEFDDEEQEIQEIVVNKYVAFNDISRGLLSHEWQIEDGMRYMNGNFTAADTLNYARFVKSGVGKVTSDEAIYVLFDEVGEKNVRLINTYKDSVAESVKVDDVWKVDKTITVTVLEE
ncbi:hypothetical protein M4I21_06045 [Cellulophaga sp. 20_2_10]|uniref:hypothetical protein n=1 Tax=Cellulophaga sp. 20_2_10 TaxID=2942476 RepID=UPI00201B04C1|nr:hypothetical protein [Cellulophaga sp. 20_2_10]MCL5245361.1 hypothetical protein [Cellulophaga sp. 20_2_10]